MKKALFLDRDGILNKVIFRNNIISSPHNLSEFTLIEDSISLIQYAKKKGYMVIVITNQPDVSRKYISSYELLLMHNKLKKYFQIDDIFVCISENNSDFRRKPNPGMIFEAANKYNIDLRKSFFVGDGEKDILAGKAAGVKTILLETSYNKHIHGTADYNVNDYEKIKFIL